jgi:GntR family transcriptional regulator, rspAB operon transcriptional repressor
LRHMAKETLKDKAYQIIKEKIITCQYKPGTLLNEIELVQEVDSSHTPIREALSRLEQENLVKFMPKKGIWVTDIVMSDVRDVYEVRELIEPHIIRRWGCDISKDELKEYMDHCKKSLENTKDEEGKFKLDYILHDMILDQCRNAHLTRTMNQLQDQTRRLRNMTGNRNSRLKYIMEEHIEITKWLLESDYEKAAQAMIYHLQQGKQSSFDLLMGKGV